MATTATADNRELATDCCNATDILVVTCNQNRITDDDYTVKLNGHVGRECRPRRRLARRVAAAPAPACGPVRTPPSCPAS